jgi:hypothetical protein
VARAGAALVAAALALAAREARAWEATPKALAAKVGAAAAPSCDLCHAAATAPVGAASRPFAAALVARGLVDDGEAALDAALAKMRAERVDSDGDGAQDLDEVAWGADPNHADVPQSEGAPPEYGCSTRAPGRAPGGAAIAVAVALVAAVGRARLRRRR